MKNFWDERYSTNGYIYGTNPNVFFKEQIEKIKSGRLLLLGEGEGRNAVYAAKLGWLVDAIDSSIVAREKAIQLAKLNNVEINYIISDVHTFSYPLNTYDAIGIIFLHINENKHETFILYQKLFDSLKPNGRIILELFSKNQLGKKSGGPQELEMLCSIEQIRKLFPQLKPEILREENIFLSEGNFHQGDASVIRYVGIK